MTTVGEFFRKIERVENKIGKMKERLEPHQRGTDMKDLHPEAKKFISKTLGEIRKEFSEQL